MGFNSGLKELSQEIAHFSLEEEAKIVTSVHELLYTTKQYQQLQE
jgi:hypothetical protein